MSFDPFLDNRLAKARARVARCEYRRALSALNDVVWNLTDRTSPSCWDETRALLERALAGSDGRTRRTAHELLERLAERYQQYSGRLEVHRAREGLRSALRESALAVVTDCTVFGGHGVPLQAGDVCDVACTDDILLMLELNALAVTGIRYEHIVALEIGGPGKTVRGGGFVGGGFGIRGAVEGMLIAHALNQLTTKVRIDTVICLQSKDAEVFLHHTGATPDQLRVRLSPVFSRLRSIHIDGAAVGSAPVRDVAAQLAQLADLHASGALTDAEFAAAKDRLLG